MLVMLFIGRLSYDLERFPPLFHALLLYLKFSLSDPVDEIPFLLNLINLVMYTLLPYSMCSILTEN